MAYNLLITEVYWGYNPLTNLLLTSWDILVLSGYSHKISFDNICLDDAILFMVAYL